MVRFLNSLIWRRAVLFTTESVSEYIDSAPNRSFPSPGLSFFIGTVSPVCGLPPAFSRSSCASVSAFSDAAFRFCFLRTLFTFHVAFPQGSTFRGTWPRYAVGALTCRNEMACSCLSCLSAAWLGFFAWLDRRASCVTWAISPSALPTLGLQRVPADWAKLISACGPSDRQLISPRWKEKS